MPRTKCPSCGKRANYAFVKTDKQWVCKSHSIEGMKDVKNKQCAFDNCNKMPSFGLESGKRTHCSEHASDQMKNVKHKRCQFDNCEKHPSYGLEWNKPTHCSEHASDQMEDVVSKRCQHDNCDKIPAFGLEWGKPTHCSEHASDQMKDVVSKRCQFYNCETRPVFGLEWMKPTHCAEHASDQMINVVSKRCQFDGCEIQPNFGLEWMKPTHCAEHASDQMKDVKSKRCRFVGCETRPVFGLEWMKPTHCSEHASIQMKDVKHNRCELCQMNRMNPKYKPHCAQCHFYLNPDDPRIRNYKTKENAVMAEVQKVYPEIILDSRVAGGCSKRRPDGYIDRFSHVIIIEVDENEHRSYDDTCSNRRMMELYEDFGSRDLVFIRLNPDAYTRDGKRIAGAFSVSKTDGTLKFKPKELKKRCSDLLEMVDHYILNKPDKAITVEYLYFSD